MRWTDESDRDSAKNKQRKTGGQKVGGGGVGSDQNSILAQGYKTKTTKKSFDELNL